MHAAPQLGKFYELYDLDAEIGIKQLSNAFACR